MPRKLTVVTADTAPETVEPPKSIKEAVDRPERDLTVALRRRVAAEIDAGPPAHALARLVDQLRELDKDIRALDAREEEERVKRSDGRRSDESFDASAI